MIRLQINRLSSIQDARDLLQTAIGVEFGTLPPYLYALYSIRQGTNPEAAERIKAIAQQEMIHLCLASNILNALGGTPVLKPPTYPGPLPGDIGSGGTPLTIHIYPLSREAMKQAMDIEQPENPPEIPVREMLATIASTGPRTVTIGQFYEALDHFLATLPATAWTPNRNQITDDQFFPGQLFAVNASPDAHKAIQEIVSEGEGSKNFYDSFVSGVDQNAGTTTADAFVASEVALNAMLVDLEPYGALFIAVILRLFAIGSRRRVSDLLQAAVPHDRALYQFSTKPGEQHDCWHRVCDLANLVLKGRRPHH